MRLVVDQPLDIGWCSGGGKVDGVRHQDGVVAPAEGVGICSGKIVPIAVFFGKRLRERLELPWWVGETGRNKDQIYLLV